MIVTPLDEEVPVMFVVGSDSPEVCALFLTLPGDAAVDSCLCWYLSYDPHTVNGALDFGIASITNSLCWGRQATAKERRPVLKRLQEAFWKVKVVRKDTAVMHKKRLFAAYQKNLAQIEQIVAATREQTDG